MYNSVCIMYNGVHYLKTNLKTFAKERITLN